MADLWEAADAAMKNSNYGAAVATQADAAKRAQFLGILQKTLESYSGVAKEIAAIHGPDRAMKAMAGPLQGVNRGVETLRKLGLPLPEDLGQQVLSAAVQTPTVAETGAAAGQADYAKGAVVAQNLMDAGAPRGAAMGAGFGAPFNAGRELDRPKPTMEGAFGVNQDTGEIAYRNPEILAAKKETAAAGAGKTQVSVDTGNAHKAMIDAIAPDLIKVSQEEQERFKNAGSMLDTVSQFRQLYGAGDIGGPGTALRRDFINLASALGVNLSKVGIDDSTVPTEEALGALTNELTLKFKEMYKLGSQGFTEGDRHYVEKIVDTLGKNPEARELILESWQRLAEAQQKKALVANTLVRQGYGALDAGKFSDVPTRVEITKAQEEATGDVFAGLGDQAKALNEQYQKRRGSGGTAGTPEPTPVPASSDLFKKYPQFAPKGGK